MKTWIVDMILSINIRVPIIMIARPWIFMPLWDIQRYEDAHNVCICINIQSQIFLSSLSKIIISSQHSIQIHRTRTWLSGVSLLGASWVLVVEEVEDALCLSNNWETIMSTGWFECCVRWGLLGSSSPPRNMGRSWEANSSRVHSFLSGGSARHGGSAASFASPSG